MRSEVSPSLKTQSRVIVHSPFFKKVDIMSTSSKEQNLTSDIPSWKALPWCSRKGLRVTVRQKAKPEALTVESTCAFLHFAHTRRYVRSVVGCLHSVSQFLKCCFSIFAPRSHKFMFSLRSGRMGTFPLVSMCAHDRTEGRSHRCMQDETANVEGNSFYWHLQAWLMRVVRFE